MKIESGKNELVIQSLTSAFPTQHLGAGEYIEINLTVNDSIVINVLDEVENMPDPEM